MVRYFSLSAVPVGGSGAADALLGFLLSVALFAAIRGFVVSVPLTLLAASSFVNRRSLLKAILLAMSVAALIALAMFVAGVTHPLLMPNANDDPMSLHFLEPTLSSYLWFMPVFLAIFIPTLLWLWTRGFVTSRSIFLKRDGFTYQAES